jgi:hypothetical protein
VPARHVWSLTVRHALLPMLLPQRLVEAFESLMLSAGPGAPEVDSRALARPVGEQHTLACAPQPAFNQGNCSADNMRPTVMGVPNSTALRLRSACQAAFAWAPRLLVSSISSAVSASPHPLFHS